MQVKEPSCSSPPFDIMIPGEFTLIHMNCTSIGMSDPFCVDSRGLGKEISIV